MGKAQHSYRAIRNHLIGEEITVLSAEEEKVLDRYIDLYGLVKKYGQNNQTVIRFYKALKKHSDDLPSDIYLIQDINNSMRLFGDIDRVNNDVLQKMLVDSLWEDILNIGALASLCIKKDENGDIKKMTSANEKTYDRLLKLKSRFAKNISEASGMKNTMPDMPNLDKLETHTYIIELDSESKKVMGQLAKNGKGLIDLRGNYDEAILDDERLDDFQIMDDDTAS